jgi:hypothetical protein
MGQDYTIKDFKVATWNVGGITCKEEELIGELRNGEMYMSVISEIKKKSRTSKH